MSHGWQYLSKLNHAKKMVNAAICQVSHTSFDVYNSYKYEMMNVMQHPHMTISNRFTTSLKYRQPCMEEDSFIQTCS